MLITVIGRGHSGTRAMSHTLTASGVFMGDELNESGDLVPPQAMYEACRIVAKHVRYLGDLEWDFSALHAMPVEPEFEDLVGTYLRSVLSHDERAKGWKIPETLLAYPWIVRMFPDARYIYWVRDPRDSILGRHITDDLERFHIPFDGSADTQRRRAVSWKYQAAIYRATPRPRHLIEIRFEDFVLDQAATLRRIEHFLGIPMAKIAVKREAVGRWRQADPGAYAFGFLSDELVRFGYADAETTRTPASA